MIKDSKKNKLLTFLVCGNGYGHFKRCAKITHYLINANQDVTVNLVCNDNIIKANQDWIILKDLYKFSNFNLISTKKKVRIINNKINYKDVFNDDFSWIDKTIITKSDIVISDNCTSILKYRPDAILMGSFLWSEVFSIYVDNNIEIQKYCKDELDLLKKHKPQMISLKDMSMPYVKNYTNVFYTDWLVSNRNQILIKKKIKNILILGGGTGLVDNMILKIVNLIQSKFNVYSNEKIVNKSLTNKIIINKFDFTADSFNNIDLIIARPGIGTLTDSITYGIPIFGISESAMVNKEIQFNLKKIESLKIGLDISPNVENIIDVILKIQKNYQYYKFQNNLINRGIKGIEQTVNFITKKLDEKK
tara:strand:+ start:4569 stop:5654 length:1086 start_codon:yes stop_codon:yes gene_type:complete